MQNILHAYLYKLKHKKIALYMFLFLTLIIASFEIISITFLKDIIIIINEIIITNLDKVLVFTILFSNLFYEPFKYNTIKNIFILKIPLKKFFLCGIIVQFIIILFIVLYFSIFYFIAYILLNSSNSDLITFIQIFSIKLIHLICILLAITSINNCVILLFKNDFMVFLFFLVQCNLNMLIYIFNKFSIITVNIVQKFTINTQINILSSTTIDIATIINSIIITTITIIIYNIIAYYIYKRRTVSF